jgi:hypothetical protein
MCCGFTTYICGLVESIRHESRHVLTSPEGGAIMRSMLHNRFFSFSFDSSLDAVKAEVRIA